MGLRSLRLALVQMNPTVGDLAGNRARMADALRYAKGKRADLVAFPELALSGYPPEDLLLAPRFLRACRRELERLVEATAGVTVVVGYPEWNDDVYNAAAIFHDGRIVAHARKWFLPNYGVFDEERYFQRGRHITVVERCGIRVGVSICEDIWYPNGPPTWQALTADAEILLNISASPYERGKRARRRAMLETRASDSNAMVAFVNTVGGQDELIFDGGSLICDARGRTVVEAATFEEGILVYDCVVDGVLGNRLHDPRRRKVRQAARLPEGAELALTVLAEPKRVAGGKSSWREVGLAKPLADEEEEVYTALVTGLRDYVVKNGFRSVVLGLSGGIDSALTACIAVDALGAERVMGLIMPSRFSSQQAMDDAETLAENLGIRWGRLSIEGPFQAYLDVLKPLFRGRAWDETEENLQARIRGNLVMAVSNKFGQLVLTTGNKSELSVGYATLYGDMAGGFNVLKDVLKTWVYRLAWYRNGIEPVIPKSIIDRAPSAELRPNQTDQDTLPPYDLLDAVLEAYIEEDLGLDEIVARGYTEDVVKRILKMVDRAEYKRRQAAPGIKITGRAFGRDRRLPITNRYSP